MQLFTETSKNKCEFLTILLQQKLVLVICGKKIVRST